MKTSLSLGAILFKKYLAPSVSFEELEGMDIVALK
jgi:hypothetical protein